MKSSLLASTIVEALIAFYLAEQAGEEGAQAFARVLLRTRMKISSKDTIRKLKLAEDMARKHGNRYVYILHQEIDALEPDPS